MIRENKELIYKIFENLGFKIIYFNDEDSANGQDMFVQKNNNKPLSVEIKTISYKQSGALQVDPVSEKRKKDDLIAIIIENYILIEPMEDHLKCCSDSGYRPLTLLK